MVAIRAKNGVGATHEPPFQRGRLTNLLTPHPGPLPLEGRGRIGRPVHGLNARNLVSRNSLPARSSRGEGEERWRWWSFQDAYPTIGLASASLLPEGIFIKLEPECSNP